MKEKFIVGSIVMAIAGREKKQLFIITKIENQTVYLVNGKNRKIENAKKKNLKHIHLLKRENSFTNKIENNTITNGEVIKILKDYKALKNV